MYKTNIVSFAASKMRKVCLWSCLVLFLQVRDSRQHCSVVETPEGLTNYKCNSIQELEQQGAPDMLDVIIFNGASIPVVRNATHSRKPNLQVVLLEESGNGFGPDTYTALKRLHQIFAHSTQVGTLKANVFENLPLQELKLDQNYILSIENGAFATLKSLEKLYVVKNQLNVVKAGVFNNLPVETLALSNNKISFIERNAFANLPNLKQLYLDGNQLTEFQPELYMTQRDLLEVLWLNNNSLTEIDRNVLSGFDNLRELNLQDNRISKIFSYTFERLLNLETLYLSNNLLLDLTPESFPQEGMPKLTKLFLNNNRLAYLTNPVLGKLTKLKIVRIGGNPWQCPCLDLIQRWLGDYGVKQVCDRDYYSGTRPICVVVDPYPGACNYKSEQFHYYMYNEVNNKSPESPHCELSK